MAPVKTAKAKAGKKVKYEPVLKLPPLRYEEFVALKDNVAVNGVLVPILVDSDGPTRRIIDGNYRKQIANELGYSCPEIIHSGLDDEEMRTLARARNGARGQVDTEQKRELISDQLRETPGKTNRVVAKALGVHHATVASVRTEMESVGQIDQLERRVGSDGKTYRSGKPIRTLPRPPEASASWVKATTLVHGDCRKELKKIQTGTIDAIITRASERPARVLGRSAVAHAKEQCHHQAFEETWRRFLDALQQVMHKRRFDLMVC